MTTAPGDEKGSAAPPPEQRRGWFARTFRAFRYRDFRYVWLGAITSTTGTWMQTVAQSWLVYKLTDSPFYLGLDAFLATAPMILFSLIGGVLADRFERRRILMLSQFAQMTFAFVLAALIWFDVVAVWHIFVLSFLTGTAQAFSGPAYQALLPLLVGRDDVQNAIALNSLQFNLARMIGPVLAGLAFASIGAAGCFALNGLSFVAVIIGLLMIRTGRKERERTSAARQNGGLIADVREGLMFLRRSVSLVELTFIAFTTTLLGMPLVTLLPDVAAKTFGLDARGFGWMMAASGAGSVTGALFVAGGRRPHAKHAMVAQIVFSVFLLTFAFSTNLWLSCLAIFFAGGSLLNVITTVSSLVQLESSEAMRGRVMSIFMMAFRGGMPVGSLIAGWVAQRWSVSLALGINAVILSLIGATFLVAPTKVRDL